MGWVLLDKLKKYRRKRLEMLIHLTFSPILHQSFSVFLSEDISVEPHDISVKSTNRDICGEVLDHHKFSLWLGGLFGRSYLLNQCCHVNWTQKNNWCKFSIMNMNIPIVKNLLGHCVCKILAMLYRPHSVNSLRKYGICPYLLYQAVGVISHKNYFITRW